MSKFVQSLLGDCCEIVSGATPKTGVDEYWDGDVLWATPKDLSNLSGIYIDNTPRRITEAGLKSCAASILPAGSVLFSSRAPIGHVAINTRPLATNQGFKSFIPSDKVDAKYLAYWLKANRSYLESLGNGATFKEVSKATIAKVEIPLPPLDEQRRIAQVLDRVDALRAKRRKAIALIEGLTRSLFLDIFGDPRQNLRAWPTTTLSCLIDPGDRINYGVVQPGDEYDNGVALVRVGDLVDNHVDRSAIKRIDPKIDAKYSRSRLKGNEILVGCVGSIGSVALASKSDIGSNIARAVARIPISSEVQRIYVAEYLRSDYAQHYFKSELRTVAQPTLNIRQLSETIVMIPPHDMQAEFVSRIASVDALRHWYLLHLAKLDALFASLRDRAFRGELWNTSTA